MDVNLQKVNISLILQIIYVSTDLFFIFLQLEMCMYCGFFLSGLSPLN